MNKILTASVLALSITLSSSALAAGLQPAGGFRGPGVEPVTIAQALELKDDTAVIINGQIEKSLGDEKYLFKDSTGSVTIEIDDEDWRGLTVTPEDTITIYGEVDKELFKTEIDVDHVTLKK